MTHAFPASFRRVLWLGLAAVLASCASPTLENAADISASATKAMGADSLTTLRYIVPLHGRVVPLSELYVTAGKALPAR